MTRNLAAANAERLRLAETITWWRHRAEQTSDPMTLASYRRIIMELVALAESKEKAHAHA